MESVGFLDDNEIFSFIILGDIWSCFFCKNLFRIVFLCVYLFLVFVVGILIFVMGFRKNNLKFEGVRMVGVSLVYFSVFWFILGNFVDFCINIYGKDFYDIEEGNIIVVN